MSNSYSIEPIGVCRTPYAQKFAIPRQPGLVPAAQGIIEMAPGFDNPDLLRGLEQYSHIWLTFLFHQNLEQGWRPTIRPPRLGGNARIGVLASRSTFRPNGLGQSVVEIEAVDIDSRPPRVIIRGMDLLDGTPIIDIKPYIPYADSIPKARGGMAQKAPQTISVEFAKAALQLIQQLPVSKYPNLQQIIVEVLQQDPRPAYKAKRQDDKRYTMQLFDLDISWHFNDGCAKVESVAPLNN
ncbi:tRNA (N6-threonylcarbamoyladenosine(37)-N6)-methyltransferase TrmO [Paraferrimonas sedimenticola]|uniref:tRNA (N6-threonylcarbamoyladenosine(37)-N6)-methyltransferase TrmO n=1 Tax=Paraferrimonas sedimenticola TaxID=375674 RepID=A0AA37RX36_9GAMM|nr:tRNA (N6-threonylcarbamoyladenosine(37)-N6)-methyltransferase TrmO [Paraferrimonas sedimenticola]GLP96691.1 tRNA (N6-threonylcarbamoyladenosine(37)-N6)-methyltransferase TrmO [Paraferrimonas sedimenticola]